MVLAQVLTRMNSVFKMMNSVLKMMDSALELTNYALNKMNYALKGHRGDRRRQRRAQCRSVHTPHIFSVKAP